VSDIHEQTGSYAQDLAVAAAEAAEIIRANSGK
jgi:hypothetical protein